MHLEVGEGLAWVHLVSAPCLERQSLWCPLGDCDATRDCSGRLGIDKASCVPETPQPRQQRALVCIEF